MIETSDVVSVNGCFFYAFGTVFMTCFTNLGFFVNTLTSLKYIKVYFIRKYCLIIYTLRNIFCFLSLQHSNLWYGYSIESRGDELNY